MSGITFLCGQTLSSAFGGLGLSEQTNRVPAGGQPQTTTISQNTVTLPKEQFQNFISTQPINHNNTNSSWLWTGIKIAGLVAGCYFIYQLGRNVGYSRGFDVGVEEATNIAEEAINEVISIVASSAETSSTSSFPQLGSGEIADGLVSYHSTSQSQDVFGSALQTVSNIASGVSSLRNVILSDIVSLVPDSDAGSRIKLNGIRVHEVAVERHPEYTSSWSDHLSSALDNTGKGILVMGVGFVGLCGSLSLYLIKKTFFRI